MSKIISKIEDLDGLDIDDEGYMCRNSYVVYYSKFQKQISICIKKEEIIDVELLNIKIEGDLIKPYPTYTLQEIVMQLKTRYNFNIEYQAEQVKLNDEDIKICKALKTLNYNWITRDMDKALFAYDIEPIKDRLYFMYEGDDHKGLLLTNDMLSPITFDNSPYEIPNFE